jgi:hypothetical protein
MNIALARASTRSLSDRVIIPASCRQAALSIMNAADGASFIGKIRSRSSGTIAPRKLRFSHLGSAFTQNPGRYGGVIGVARPSSPPGQPRLFPLPPQAPSSWSTRRNAPTWCALSWRSTRRCVDCRDVGVEGIVVDESMAADTSWRICRVDIHLTNGRGKRSTHSINIPLSALSRGGTKAAILCDLISALCAQIYPSQSSTRATLKAGPHRAGGRAL